MLLDAADVVFERIAGVVSVECRLPGIFVELERGRGGKVCVPFYHLLEDAAPAEISRAQVWQWIHHGATLEDGRPVTPELFSRVTDEEMGRIEREVGSERYRAGRFPEARRLFQRLSTAKSLEEFLTLPAYELLDHDGEPGRTA